MSREAEKKDSEEDETEVLKYPSAEKNERQNKPRSNQNPQFCSGHITLLLCFKRWIFREVGHNSTCLRWRTRQGMRLLLMAKRWESKLNIVTKSSKDSPLSERTGHGVVVEVEMHNLTPSHQVGFHFIFKSHPFSGGRRDSCGRGGRPERPKFRGG